MKKLLYVAAATTLVLSSCSDNEITSTLEKSKTPISVNVYSQSKTRAVTETTTTVLQNNGFKLVALNGTTELINTTPTYSAGAWSYGTNVYWPTNESTEIKFFGIYPSTVTLNAATDKATVTVDGTTDVVASYKSSSLSSSPNGAVTLSFSHILTEILVTAIGNNPDFTYLVTGITFSEPATIDYTFSTGATAATAGAATQQFSYLATNTEVSTAETTNLGEVVVLPPLATTLTIAYDVIDIAGGTTNLTKSANIPALAAGSVNKINLTLPSERTAMTFTVDEVETWVEGTTTNGTFNQ